MIYISNDLYLLGVAGEIVPLKHPRIGYRDVVNSVVATSTATGFHRDMVMNDFTYERWRPDSLPAKLTLSFDGEKDIDYIAIGAHTLAGRSVTIQFEDLDIVKKFIPASNNAILVLFEETKKTQIEILIDGAGLPEIGVVRCGEALAMERGLYGGHSPITMSRQTTKNIYLSEEGEYLGTRIKRRGYQTNFGFDHLSAGWVREYFDPFVKHAIERPFFVGWRPVGFPSEVVYGWTDEDIVPVNTGVRDYMSVDFTVRGYYEL